MSKQNPSDFLFDLNKKLVEVRPQLLFTPRKRASVALIFRVTPPKNVLQDKIFQDTPKNTLDFCQAPWVKQGNLELLFLKRAFNPHDQWGGHVGLPGGKKRGIESDFSVAQRETFEEVGLTLEDREQFSFLGRLNDRATTPRVPLIVSTFGTLTKLIHIHSIHKQILVILSILKKLLTIVMSHFSFDCFTYWRSNTQVFVQLSPKSITLKLDYREVHSARWISWSFLSQKFKTKDFVPLEVGGNHSYPSLFLPRENEILAIRPKTKEFPDEENNVTYRLWGITFDIVQDCFDLVEYGFMKPHSYL